MEINPATQIYETMFRGYDPSIGRFTQIDPLTDLIPGITSYNFAFNNPISFVDQSGLIGQSGDFKNRFRKFVNRIKNNTKRRIRNFKQKLLGWTYTPGKNNPPNNGGGSNDSRGGEIPKPSGEGVGLDLADLLNKLTYVPDVEKKEEKREEKKQTDSNPILYDLAGTELELDESKRIFRANTPFYINNNRRMVRQYLSPLVRDLTKRKDLKVIINIRTPQGAHDNATDDPPYPYEDVLRDRANTLKRELEDMGLDEDQVETHNEFNKKPQTIKFKIEKK